MGVFFLGLGLLMVFGAISLTIRNIQSRNWATTTAEVLRSEYESYESVDSDGFASTCWRAHLRYRYTAGQRDYFGDSVGIAQSLPVNEKSCKHQATTYPVGSHPTVFYDPAHPQRCCLDRRVTIGSAIGLFLVFVLGLLLSAIGIALLLPNPGSNGQ